MLQGVNLVKATHQTGQIQPGLRPVTVTAVTCQG